MVRLEVGVDLGVGIETVSEDVAEGVMGASVMVEVEEEASATMRGGVLVSAYSLAISSHSVGTGEKGTTGRLLL